MLIKYRNAMSRINLRNIIAVAIFLTSYAAQSQITILGPVCATPGSEYHYIVTLSNPTSSAYQVCVQGGIIKDAPATCVSQFSSSVIKIIWNNVATGSITVSSGAGNQIRSINITSDLQPGEINQGSLQQVIEKGSVPDTLKCSVARKGSCSPVYIYQWQQSQNKIEWEDITYATSKNMKFTTTVSEPKYYRRKVTETNSGTIKFSGVASVYIIPRPD